ncbi:MAG: cell filamentation protein Fic [Rhodospirillum sp.]|nr:cell filamentation protein Fic [Rhodospirillum sp.]
MLGATPLSEEERFGLKQHSIATRAELNAAEQANIESAHVKLFGRRRQTDPMKIIDEDFVKRVHRQMYSDVWSWAGKYRMSEKNIGITWPKIRVAVISFLGDATAWVQYGSYPPDEIAVRFHHSLVKIHLFPNGNGRHSRTMADLLTMALGRQRFTWGGANLGAKGDVRECYIDTLRAADNHSFDALIAFARS